MTFLVRTTVRCSIKTFVYVNTYLDFKAGIVGEYVSSLASTVISSFVGFQICLRTDHLFLNAFDLSPDLEYLYIARYQDRYEFDQYIHHHRNT